MDDAEGPSEPEGGPDGSRAPAEGPSGTEPTAAVSRAPADLDVAAPHIDVEDDGGEVAGTLAPDTPVEPGRLDARNALFVVIGGYLGVLAVAAFIGAGSGLSLRTTAVVTVGYGTLAAVAYALLARADPDT